MLRPVGGRTAQCLNTSIHRAVRLVEAARHDALQAECAGVPEHALTVRRVHVLGKISTGPALRMSFFNIARWPTSSTGADQSRAGRKSEA